jgi:hypothetical protein
MENATKASPMLPGRTLVNVIVGLRDATLDSSGMV